MGTGRYARASFTLGRVRIEVEADDDRVTDGLRRRLRPLVAATDGPADVRFVVRGPGGELPSVPAGGPRRCVYETPLGDLEYVEPADVLCADLDAVRLVCSPGAGRIDVSIVDPLTGPVLAVNPCFTIPLMEVVKRHGLYAVHAGCVVGDRGAIVLAGSSGSGKTTATIALVRAGFGFVSDDIVFLERHGDALTIVGLPDEVDVTEGTIAMIPELAPLLDEPPPPGRPKRRCRVETVLRAPLHTECTPSVLLVPEVGPGPASLAPISGTEALLALAPNVLLTEPASSQAHFNALAALVRLVPSYRLHMGPDLDEVVDVVRERA